MAAARPEPAASGRLAAEPAGASATALARPAVRRTLESLTGLVLVGFGVRLEMERR